MLQVAAMRSLGQEKVRSLPLHPSRITTALGQSHPSDRTFRVQMAEGEP
ncbi:MAG TPA: hypothetical protein V6D30_20635 [Leptolyngbyaceae cyanobacterium]